jgi:hypothetical protein
VKRICRYLPLLLASASCIPFAAAQSTFDFNIGFGAVQDKAATTGTDNSTLNTCTLGSAANPVTGEACSPTPSLSGFMLGFGGNLMLWKHFGVGAEVSIQPGKQNYLALNPLNAAAQGLTADEVQSRVTFYDFNGIYQPVKSKKAALDISGGVGGANIKLYENQAASTSLLGSQSQSQFIGSHNHFQVHAGVGVQIYLTDHFFIRPQFDIHYVTNLTEQFGSKLVTQEMVWVGYSFGGQ